MEAELDLLQASAATVLFNENSELATCSSPPPERLKLTAREVVDSVKISVLLAAHRNFCAEWSSRKKAATRVIRKKSGQR